MKIEKFPEDHYYFGDKVYIIRENMIHRVVVYGITAVDEKLCLYKVRNSYLDISIYGNEVFKTPDDLCEYLKEVICD